MWCGIGFQSCWFRVSELLVFQIPLPAETGHLLPGNKSYYGSKSLAQLKKLSLSPYSIPGSRQCSINQLFLVQTPITDIPPRW